MTFEEALENLNSIKDKLDLGEVTLDESLKLYEESVKYTKICLDLLKETEGKVVAIKEEVDKLVEKPFNATEE